MHEVLQEEEVVRPPAPLDRIGAVAESAQKSSPAREAREEELFDLLDRQCKSGVPAPCRDSLREYLCNAAQRSCNHGVSEIIIVKMDDRAGWNRNSPSELFR